MQSDSYSTTRVSDVIYVKPLLINALTAITIKTDLTEENFFLISHLSAEVTHTWATYTYYLSALVKVHHGGTVGWTSSHKFK